MPIQDQRLNFVIQELTRRSEDITVRLRNIEQRLDTLEQRFSVMEELDIERNKKNDKLFLETANKMSALNDEIVKLKMFVEKLNKQTDKYARKSELKEIETVIGITHSEPLKEEV